MSCTKEKKLSTILSNIDHNSYRAFKVILKQSKAASTKNSRNASPMQIKQPSLSKYPFGLTEKRFKWQLDKFINVYPTLSGTMKTYDSARSIGEGGWNGAVNTSMPSEGYKNKFDVQRKLEKRLQENCATQRTINPKLSNDLDPPAKLSKKMNFNTSHRPTPSSGSIENLLQKTPGIIQTYKRYSERLLQSNNIFTPEIPKYKMQKKRVDIEQLKLKKGYAGIKSHEIDEIKYFNETNFITRKMRTTAGSTNQSFEKVKMKKEQLDTYFTNTRNKAADTIKNDQLRYKTKLSKASTSYSCK